MARAARILPSRAYMRECYDYYPMVGNRVWLVRPVSHFLEYADCNMGAEGICKAWNSKFAGKPAGNTTQPTMRLDGVMYIVSRLIWRYMTGDVPDGWIDHINGDRLDNRWANLRLATPSQNAANRRIHKNNIAGLKGVSSLHGRFYAEITIAGRRLSLGSFATPEEAHAAYAEAARKYHGAFARTE